MSDLAEVRAALEPFAKEADRYDPDEGDDHQFAWANSGGVTIGMLRRARKALAALSRLTLAAAGTRIRAAALEEAAKVAERYEAEGYAAPACRALPRICKHNYQGPSYCPICELDEEKEGMSKPLAKAALEYLQIRDAVVTAYANKDDAAWDLAEEEETARRVMADAIIRADPQLKDDVRKVCKFAAEAP